MEVMNTMGRSIVKTHASWAVMWCTKVTVVSQLWGTWVISKSKKQLLEWIWMTWLKNLEVFFSWWDFCMSHTTCNKSWWLGDCRSKGSDNPAAVCDYLGGSFPDSPTTSSSQKKAFSMKKSPNNHFCLSNFLIHFLSFAFLCGICSVITWNFHITLPCCLIQVIFSNWSSEVQRSSVRLLSLYRFWGISWPSDMQKRV